MFPNIFFFFLFIFLFSNPINSIKDSFIYNGFSNANLHLDGIASITPTGLLQMTNKTLNNIGHAFHPLPFNFKSESGKTLSFSATFVFAIRSDISDLSGQGLAFVISKTTDLSNDVQTPSQYLGLFTVNNNGKSSNHVFAVELDTIQNPDFHDINNNHVGIDINSLTSINSSAASYYDDSSSSLQNLTLISGQPMQVWVDYDGGKMKLDVTLAPMNMSKPSIPLVSIMNDLSAVMNGSMYIGFSSSNGPFRTYHYVLGWSFKMNGVAQSLDYANLPQLPVIKTPKNSNALAIWLPITICSSVVTLFVLAILIIRRKRKYAELLEDWEHEYGPHRFSYKDLFQATKGFKEKELLGTGGFGRVYKGVLPNSNLDVAVKRVSHDSSQGMKEFVAEIVSIGQLRHRNLVQLLGYCRRRGELLLVYDFMPNGSLDRFLHDRTKPTLTWDQRFRIIKGVASGLLYLHEDWDQVVVHRDIKASNVLLDGELNGRLGDFGLARLYDRGVDPQTTHVVGTMGYISPELAMNGKATTVSDVYAFGAFLLEVVCGRRPIDTQAECEEMVLVDWVLEKWRNGNLMEAMDGRLREEYNAYEVELVLKLGLLCSHPMPVVRPSTRLVMQILDGDAELPELLPNAASYDMVSVYQNLGFDNYIHSMISSTSSVSVVTGVK